MRSNVHILMAVHDARMARAVWQELDDGEHTLVQAVCDGRQALACCRRAMPDILVIDAVLPGLDGLAVVDALQAAPGGRMPKVIACGMTPFAREGFARRGAYAVLDAPWDGALLREALRDAMRAMEEQIDWAAAQEAYARACALLTEMGMRPALKGFAYLAWSAALCCEQESRLFAIGQRLYVPIAQRFGTTSACVERLIRHAVESTMDAGKARGVYALLGNTIDPARGKPTNAQIIAQLVQRLRLDAQTVH